MTPWARFDDFAGGRAHQFGAAAHIISAWQIGDVADALTEVEYATSAGWWAYGFVSYEAAAGLDPGLAVHRPVNALPLVWFGITSGPQQVPLITPPRSNAYHSGPWRCDWTATQHQRRVNTVRSRIADGETYQTNLTTRMRARVTGDLAQLYANLALRQRGAYNAYLDLGRYVIASASPELFFELSDGQLTMRPMKGTAPRGHNAIEDDRIKRRLLASSKERAENIMIVDLIRNDLARLAVTGSVHVAALCQAEQYATVHQVTSSISAELRPEAELVDIFRALFPCGSVTGVPKSRTMQLIRELEDGPRGVYCGAIGVVAPPSTPSRARFSVAIRTAVIDRDLDTAVYGTGSGITWSSEPQAEYEELLTKARLLDLPAACANDGRPRRPQEVKEPPAATQRSDEIASPAY